MRFLVRSPGGSESEVELAGTVAVVGRDPSCELVIDDAKCSRRHAILEARPDGLSIRDNESANGVFVNGRQVQQAKLDPGDVIRLGEAAITVLQEKFPQTVAMDHSELAALAAGDSSARSAAPPAVQPPPPAAAPPPQPTRSPAPAPRRPAPAPPPARPAPPPPPAAPIPEAAPRKPQPGPASRIFAKAPEAGPIPRPLTVTLLSTLWWASVLLYLVGAGFGIVSLSGLAAAGAAIGGLLMAVLSGIMASGLSSMRPWARLLQIGIAALGLLNLPFTIAAAATLIYMLGADAKLRFSGRRDYSLLKPAEAEIVRIGAREGIFTGILLANLAVVALVVGMRATQAIPLMLKARAEANEAAVLAQVRAVVAAQAAFKAACGAGFADAEGLTNPASTLAGYPAGKAPFLEAELLTRDRLDYHFELEASDPAPETQACRRSFRRYEYLVVPLRGSGRYFLATEGVIHEARGRPAKPKDPAVPD